MNRKSIAAVLVAVGLTVAGIGVASAAYATPNIETVLPADGVTSIEALASDQFGATQWEVTTTAPATEIKYMGPGPQQIVCSANRAALGVDHPDYVHACATVERFIASAGCVYLQFDGIPGQNSSDPYVCRTAPTPTGEPSWTPTTPPTETSTPTPTYTPPVVNCEPPFVPGWLDDHGNPTSCVNDGPMPTVTGTPKPTTTPPSTGTPSETTPPSSPATTPPTNATGGPSSPSVPDGAGSVPSSAVSSVSSSVARSSELAATGSEWLPLAVFASVVGLAGIGATVLAYRRRTRS